MVEKSDTEDEQSIHEMENLTPVKVHCKYCNEEIAFLDDFISTQGSIWTIECCELFDAMDQHDWDYVYCKCGKKIATFIQVGGFDVSIFRCDITLNY